MRMLQIKTPLYFSAGKFRGGGEGGGLSFNEICIPRSVTMYYSKFVYIKGYNQI